MFIDWQTVFYILASVGMLMFFILMVTVFVLVLQLVALVRRVHNFFDRAVGIFTDINNFKKGTLVTILDIVHKIIKKGEKNYGK